MITEIRVLNAKGLSSFNDYLQQLRNGATDTPPAYLLSEEEYSSPLPVAATLDDAVELATKFEFSQYVAGILGPILEDESRYTDVGLWSWLALYYFDLICPVKGNGKRTVNATYRYILSNQYKNQYRHLVRTPCLMFHLHGRNARPVIAGKLTAHGEASEALASRQRLFANRPLFEAIDKLYVTESSDGDWEVKRGARGKGGGSMRRLGKVMRQFDLTYDFYSMTGDQIYDILPAEFGKFKEAE